MKQKTTGVFKTRRELEEYLYKAGKEQVSQIKLAELAGVSLGTVANIHREQGIRYDKGCRLKDSDATRLTRELREKIIELLKENKSISEIRTLTNISTYKIRKVAREEKIRRTPGNRKGISEETIELMVAEFKNCLNVSEVVRKFGYSFFVVRKILADKGCKINAGRGKNKKVIAQLSSEEREQFEAKTKQLQEELEVKRADKIEQAKQRPLESLCIWSQARESIDLTWKEYGFLAFRKLGVKEKIKVYRGAEGFYLGVKINGEFVSRESRQFWRNEEDAVFALESMQWAQKLEK